MKSVIWMSEDMMEQIVTDNGEYILTKVGTSYETQLGQNVNQAKANLKKLGRSDIATQIF